MFHSSVVHQNLDKFDGLFHFSLLVKNGTLRVDNLNMEHALLNKLSRTIAKNRRSYYDTNKSFLIMIQVLVRLHVCWFVCTFILPTRFDMVPFTFSSIVATTPFCCYLVYYKKRRDGWWWFFTIIVEFCEGTKLVCTSVAASRSWASSSSSSSSATPGGIAKYEERKYDHTKSSTIEEIQKHTRG